MTLARRRWLLAAGGALAGAVVVVARRPDAVLHPQFYAEDAIVWYGQAYAFGPLQALGIPYGGYLQSLPRLVAAGAVQLPFAFAPSWMNAWGIFFQVLPVFYLLAGRLDDAIPSKRVQALLAAIYLLLPYSYEVDVSITNAQWHLAVLCLLIAVSRPPATAAWWAFDVAAMAVCGLTGPFGVGLAVVLALRLVFVARERWALTLLVLNVALAAVQVVVLQLHPHQRPFPPPGLQPGPLAHVLGGPLLVASTLGTELYRAVWSSGHWTPDSKLPFLLAAIPVAITGWAAWRGTWQLRVAIVYAWLQLLSIFLARQTSADGAYLYSRPPLAGRYYFAFYCVWFAALLFLVLRERWPLGIAPGVLLVLALVIAVPADFEYPALHDYHFERAVREFDSARPGTTVTFEVPPHHQVMLVKRAG